jgi:hypothetical protein
MSAVKVDPLEPMERDGLTIWGETISAQARDYGDPPVKWSLALHIRDDAPRGSEDGHPVEVPPGDVEKLRELLNEMAARA